MFRRKRKNKELQLKDITIIDDATLKKAVTAAALGNAMEWFDFGIYSYLAVVIGKVFFPHATGSVQILATLATFAVAFLVRPLGGFVFGPLGDKIGRKKVLALTMIIMAVSTFCIGLIPSYATIGIGAPILLLIVRLIQGFSTGGEYGGAATFIAEYSPDRKRGFMGSWLEFGTLGGYVLGAGVVLLVTSLLTSQQLLDWGWRIPFFIAGPLGLIGLYLRTRLEETPAFQEMQEQEEQENVTNNEGSLIKLIVKHWNVFLVCIGLVLVFNVTDYMLLSYMPSYLSHNLNYDTSHGLLLILFVMLGMMIIQPFMGILSDKVGRKPILYTGCIGFILLSLPSFELINTGNPVLVFLGLMILGLLLNTFTGAMPATLPAIFPTKVRYTALAISFNISVSLFGGTTPLVAAWLIDVTGNNMMPAYYMMLAAAIGIVALLFTKETANKALRGSTPAASDKAEAKEILQEIHDNIEQKVEAISDKIVELEEKKQDLIDQHPKLN